MQGMHRSIKDGEEICKMQQYAKLTLEMVIPYLVYLMDMVVIVNKFRSLSF